jgi:uncharacterized protein
MKFKYFLLLLISCLCFSQKKGDDIFIGKYDKVYSKILNEERTLMVNLPDSYDQSDQKYPVLFLLDGEVNILAEAASMIHHYGMTDITPMIIIAVNNTNRNRDMMPMDGAQKFLQFINEELIPYVETNYRAGSYRIIYGNSNSALFVVYSLLEKPETFSAYIAASPMIGWCKDLMEIKFRTLNEQNIRLNKFLYVIHGGSDYPHVKNFLPAYLKLLKSLEKKGLKLKVKFVPDEGHVPYGSLHHGLFTLYDGYTYPEKKKNEEGVDSLKAYYERLSRRVGYKIKYPVKTLMTIGQRLLTENKVEEAIKVYELNAGHNPEIWDSNFILAYLYLKTNRQADAKKYYLKAKAISPDNPSKEFREMKDLFK